MEMQSCNFDDVGLELWLFWVVVVAGGGISALMRVRGVNTPPFAPIVDEVTWVLFDHVNHFILT